MTTKQYINSLIAKGDKRNYWEIAADLELQRWTAKMKHPLEYAQAKAEQAQAEVSYGDMYRDAKLSGLPKAETDIQQIQEVVPILQHTAIEDGES